MFVEFDNDSFRSVAGRLKSEPSFGAARSLAPFAVPFK